MVNASDEIDLAEWVRRITIGDAQAEEELVRRYRAGITIIISRIVHNTSAVEDLSQDTFRIVLEKIRSGAIRQPDRLSGFVCAVARNVAIDYIRKIRRVASHEDLGGAEQIRDPRPDQFERVWLKERAEIVREVIGELKAERDREVLTRFFIAEEDKDQICADLGLSSHQFNSVISRALKRYRILYLKRFPGM